MHTNSGRPCPHPCNFRLVRVIDRGWGEMAFEYRWSSTSHDNRQASPPCDDITTLDLEHCFLYEITNYADNEGEYREGYFFPPDPPFDNWRFRDPTDGRTAPVALGRFAASQGWAWDRHKLGGTLSPPPLEPDTPFSLYTIVAQQQYRFHCERCGMDAPVPGSNSGPHALQRTFTPIICKPVSASAKDAPAPPRACVWRYTFQKHGHAATLDIAANGEYIDDSAHLGFGFW